MQMVFEAGTQVTVLWEWWAVQTKAQYAFTFLTVALAGVLRRYLRKHAVARSKAPLSAGCLAKWLVPAKPDEEALIKRQVWLIKALRGLELTAFHALSVTLANLLMLVAMTFNVGLFLAIILGESVGYFQFDVNETLESLKGKYERAANDNSSESSPDTVPVLQVDNACPCG
jgi:solute carrier family 31 (copper transporter), member 1